MIRRWLLTLPAALMLVAVAVQPTWAGHHHGCSDCGGCDGSCGGDCGGGCAADDCGGGCADCGETEMVTKTVYQPEYTTEKRTVTRHGHKWEEREKTVTVYNRVAVNEEKTCNYTVMVP